MKNELFLIKQKLVTNFKFVIFLKDKKVEDVILNFIYKKNLNY